MTTYVVIVHGGWLQREQGNACRVGKVHIKQGRVLCGHCDFWHGIEARATCVWWRHQMTVVALIIAVPACDVHDTVWSLGDTISQGRRICDRYLDIAILLYCLIDITSKRWSVTVPPCRPPHANNTSFNSVWHLAVAVPLKVPNFARQMTTYIVDCHGSLWRGWSAAASVDLCVVWFGSCRNKFVQLLIRSRNSSGRFGSFDRYC